LQKLQSRRTVFNWRLAEYAVSLLHRTKRRQFASEYHHVKLFEAATSLVIAMGVQALAVGVVVAL
jgi:hypothetical protein